MPLGTIKIQTASGIKDVNVYDPTNVDYPVVRVQTPSGVGALRLSDPADATHPYLRVQTPAGVKAVSNNRPIMETGSFNLSGSIDNGVVKSISFNNSYNNPVVVPYLTTLNGAHPYEVRARSVTSTGCEIFGEEPPDLDGGHQGEDVAYVVAEAGTWTALGGYKVEFGIHNTNTVRYHDGTNSHENWDTVSMQQSWGSAPVILHNLNTHNNNGFMATSARSVGTSSFDIAQEAAQTGQESTVTNEDIGYIMIENLGGTAGTMDGHTFETNRASDGSNDGYDDTPHSFSFNASFGSTPDHVSSGQSLNGGDGMWTRGQNPSTTGFDVYAYEDTNLDTEQGHTDEEFGFFAIDPNSNISGY